MVTVVTVIHLLLAVFVILITFFQDSKSESLGGPWGGAGSQSLFGPIGATTFIQKATWWLVALLAVTSLTLAYFSNKSSKSILDKVPLETVTSPPASNVNPAAAATDDQKPSTTPATEKQPSAKESPSEPPKNQGP
ncbi:MAG: preprotein translocase subunit SecG [Bdellovibrionaceae bacterium]|nr:preprotein translocase subunit SecG [Pseudobdellovibrionaceae bacterium]MDW8190571.1 preprotein translocase subunit SecG [Pseudobdellovibrionaceae bacterium]